MKDRPSGKLEIGTVLSCVDGEAVPPEGPNLYRKPLFASMTNKLPDASKATPIGPQQNPPLGKLVAKSFTAKPGAAIAVALAGCIAMGMIESPRRAMISSLTVLFFLIFLTFLGGLVSSHPSSALRHRIMSSPKTKAEVWQEVAVVRSLLVGT